MRYLRIYADGNEDSRFEDVQLNGTITHVVDDVSSAACVGSFACSGITFAEQPKDAVDWKAHVAPTRQWIIVISGRVAITTADGKCREVEPGEVILAEDTAGRGHLATPLTTDFQVAMIPLDS